MNFRAPIDATSRWLRMPPQPSFIAGFLIQRKIITALMIREIMSRYGHEGLGFFWVIGEPMLLTGGIMILWSMTGAVHGEGVSVVPFALSGYSMVTLWRTVVFKSMHGMRRNANLVYHSKIKYFDILLAQYLVETISIMAAFFVSFTPLYLLDLTPFPHDFLLLFGGWLLTAWFSAGFGMIIAATTELSDILDRLVHPVMYLTLPLTGIFYLVDWMPPKFRNIVLLSPLVHGSEMFRDGVFGGGDVVLHYNVPFLVMSCLVTSAIGIGLVQYAQTRVQYH